MIAADVVDTAELQEERPNITFNTKVSPLVARLLGMTPQERVRTVMNQMVFQPTNFTKVMVFAEDSQDANIVLLWELVGPNSVRSLRLEMAGEGLLLVAGLSPDNLQPFLVTKEAVLAGDLLAQWPKTEMELLRKGFALLFGLSD